MAEKEMKLPKIDEKAFSRVDFYDWWWNGDPAPPFIHLGQDEILQAARIKMAYELEVAKVRVTALEQMNKLMG